MNSIHTATERRLELRMFSGLYHRVTGIDRRNPVTPFISTTCSPNWDYADHPLSMPWDGSAIPCAICFSPNNNPENGVHRGVG